MLKSNIEQFLRETKKEVDKQLKEQQSFGKKVVLESYRKLVRESAVDTGLYRSSHLISVNAPIPDAPTTPSQQRINKEIAEINALKFNNGDKITISNSLRYSTELEAGRSRQQDPFLYGRTEQFAKSLLNRTI